MKLLYIWVKKYKAFNDSEFNFNPEHQFHFDSEKSILSYDYTKIAPDFFYDPFQNDDEDKGRISNVTAIIGNNGAGKSTLLEIIMNNLVDGEGGIKVFSLYIFEEQVNIAEKSRFKIYYYDTIANEGINQLNREIYLEPNIERKEMFDLKDKDRMILRNHLNVENSSKLSQVSIDDLKETLFINYSNIFEHTYYNYERMGNIKDISTIGLIKKDRDFLTEMKVRPLEFDCNLIFFHQEFLRQIDFICNYKSKSEIIRMPNYIEIGFVDLSFVLNKMCEQLNSKSEKNWQLPSLSDHIETLFNMFDQTHSKNLDRNAKLEFSLYKSLLTGYFYQMMPQVVPINKNEIEILDGLLVNIIKNEVLKAKDAYSFVVIILKLISKETKGKQFQFAQKTSTFLNALRLYRKWIRESKFRSINSDYLNIRFTLSSLPTDTSIGIKEFFNTYKKTAFLFDYLDFTLPVSSGENHMLSMFARFYSVLNESSKRKKEKYLTLDSNNPNNTQVKTVIVILEEADSMFHPEWQRTYLNLLMRFLCDIYRPYNWSIGNELDIQLVITSHSPIILSDIPRRNVIFLKHLDGKCVVDQSEHKETFGSNIHTLFLDSFFLNNGGTIGDFAMSKIKWAIRALDNPPNEDFIFRNKLFQTIMVIGEPIIRNKLLKMYSDKYNPNFIDVQNENMILKGKIAKLESPAKIDQTLDILKAQIEHLQEKIRVLEDGEID